MADGLKGIDAQRSQMNRILRSIFFVVLCSCALHSRAFALENQIIIQDSAGIPRSTSTVEGLGRVDFAVEDEASRPADGAVVTLSNPATGETMTATSVNGLVTFDNIAPGTWTVASTTPGLTFTNVTILAVSAGAGSTVAAGTILGVIGAGGAATAVGIGIHDATDGGKAGSTLSPSS